jgi:hypothetical protein
MKLALMRNAQIMQMMMTKIKKNCTLVHYESLRLRFVFIHLLSVLFFVARCVSVCDFRLRYHSVIHHTRLFDYNEAAAGTKKKLVNLLLLFFPLVQKKERKKSLRTGSRRRLEDFDFYRALFSSLSCSSLASL